MSTDYNHVYICVYWMIYYDMKVCLIWNAETGYSIWLTRHSLRRDYYYYHYRENARWTHDA